MACVLTHRQHGLARAAMRQVKLKDVVEFVSATLAANAAQAVLSPSVEAALAPVREALLGAVLDAGRPSAHAPEDSAAAKQLPLNARLSAMAEPRLGAVTVEVGAHCRNAVIIMADMLLSLSVQLLQKH